MRVAIVHPHLFIRGGGERLTKILASGLEKAGDTVSVTTSSLTGGFPELNDIKRKFFFRTLRFPSKSIFLKNLAELILSMKETIESFDPNVVVSMTEDTVNLGISKILRRRLKTIQYVHFPFEEESQFSSSRYIDYYRFPSWFNKRFLWAADLIVCNSLYTQAAVKRAWNETTHVVYPAIDYTFMETSENNAGPRENLVLCTGRFTKLKRQDFLLKAFRKIREKIKDARLIVAGYSDTRHGHFLKSLLDSREEAVEIRINPSDHELIQLYSSAKVYCHPRIAEHFGLTPIEAMSQGVPVVAYDSGGIRETITHGETGYLAESDEELIKYVMQMLALEHSKWTEMQRKAIRKAHEFSPDRFVRSIRALAMSSEPQ